MQTSTAFSVTLSSLHDFLLRLAPLRLSNYRQVRYVADDQCISLDQLAARDQTLLRDLYRHLSDLLYIIADTATTDAQKWEGVQDWIERHDLERSLRKYANSDWPPTSTTRAKP